MEKIRKKEAIPPTHRLSRKELGILINLKNIGMNQISNYEKLGMNEAFGFQHLKNLTERATTTLDSLESHIQKDYDQHFHSGDIGGINGQYKEEVRGRKLPPFDYWTAKLFRYTHGEVLFKKESGSVGISEIYRKHRYHDLDLNEVITTDFYRINVSKLFSPQMTQQMKVVYGDDWIKVVQEKFERQVNEVHINGKFSSFENDGERMVNAGRAHFDWMLRFFVDAEIKNEYEGYRGQKKRNYDKMAEDFVSGGQSRDMFCSEFATRSTIAALVFLNEEIAGDVAQHFNYQNAEEILKAAGTEIPEDVQKLLERKDSFPGSLKKLSSLLQKAGQSKKDSWLMARIAANRMFDLPYDEHEKLKRVHPGRMVSLLQEKGVVEKVALPPKLAEILAQ